MTIKRKDIDRRIVDFSDVASGRSLAGVEEADGSATRVPKRCLERKRLHTSVYLYTSVE